MKIYAYALQLLVNRGYFTGELTAKLKEKQKYTPEEIADVVAKLQADRYLDDDKLFENYVFWKTADGYGPYYIRERLHSKGVNKSVKEICESAERQDINLELILRDAIKKYIRTRKKKTPDALIRSCIAYITGRGFSTGEGIKIIKEEVQNESDFS